MQYNFDEIIDRKNDPFSFSAKWQGAEYVLKTLNVDSVRDDRICLETADMDFKVAPEIREDLKKLTDHGIFGYSILTPTYRKAVQSWYEKRQNWKFAPEDIYYFPGTHEAIAQCVKRYTKEGDGVIVLTPCYGYHEDVEGNGRKYVSVELMEDDGYYSINFSAFEKACSEPCNTLFILCHPHNPTGRVFTEAELVKLGDICRRHGVLILSDEVHSDILRKGQSFMPMMKACGEKGVISCTAVNKTFNLAGLAMTNVIVSDQTLKSPLESYFMLPSPFGIQAVISAYTKGEKWVDELNEYTDESLKECIELIHEKLPKAYVTMPEGGYSIYIDFSPYGLSDDEVVERIYKKAGVVLNSGLFFDDRRGKQIHRACLASPKSMIKEAIERIALEF